MSTEVGAAGTTGGPAEVFFCKLDVLIVDFASSSDDFLAGVGVRGIIAGLVVDDAVKSISESRSKLADFTVGVG